MIDTVNVVKRLHLYGLRKILAKCILSISLISLRFIALPDENYMEKINGRNVDI